MKERVNFDIVKDLANIALIAAIGRKPTGEDYSLDLGINIRGCYQQTRDYFKNIGIKVRKVFKK